MSYFRMKILWKIKIVLLFVLILTVIGFAGQNHRSDFILYVDGASLDSLRDNKEETSGIAPALSSNSINYTRLGIVSGCVLSLGTAVHYYQLNAWWKNWRRPFHFQEDLVYGKSVDKLGHAWDGAFSAFILSKSYRWTGISEENSVWIGSVGGSLFLLFVEFEDGFSQWGFDRVDAAANLMGGFYPLLQHYVPEFKNFKLKASYYPRQLGNYGNIPGQKHTFMDDYEGQTLWLSVKAGKMLPRLLPKFLNISIGYSVRNLNDQSRQFGVLLLAPDIDFSEIIPQSSGLLETISEGLDHFKFPTPAIQISPRVVWFGLYY